MFEGLFGSGKKKPAQKPATEKQVEFAEQLGVENPSSLTKEEASKEIDKILDARARRRKGWISSLEGRIEKLEQQVAKKSSKKAAKKKKKK
jgi:hypothetical protein